MEDRCEIEFLVEELPEGGYLARSLGACIVTEAADLEELRTQVREALCCHFDEGCVPQAAKLRFVKVVREELLAR